MGKKKKQDKNQKHDKQLPDKYEVQKIWAVSIIFSVVSIGLAFIALNKFGNNQDIPENFRLIWGISLGLLFPTRGGWGWILTDLLKSKDKDVHKLRLAYKVRNILSIVILAIVILPYILYSPIKQGILTFLLSAQVFSEGIADSITNAISVFLSGLSGVVGNIILGALGNLFYDFAKSIFNKLKLKKKNKQQKNRLLKKRNQHGSWNNTQNRH